MEQNLWRKIWTKPCPGGTVKHCRHHVQPVASSLSFLISFQQRWILDQSQKTCNINPKYSCDYCNGSLSLSTHCLAWFMLVGLGTFCLINGQC
ncbi:hypothetical protein XELAEV_18027151mg [Xenopus laevis]|uniref:Uncharacterized protein n=1 Tax=Xenopus laevis TaxID=8355 RepID=A0A974CWY3_XENLA|nr:hypothetical protein XELAEV_18027151mg [Xenopus laevis]